MNIVDALRITTKNFEYATDTANFFWPEAWRVIGKSGKGDCEDYALTVIWFYSDGNWFKWLWNVLFGPFRLCYCSVGGNGHLVVKYTGKGDLNGLYFDNIMKRLVSKEELKRNGYNLGRPHTQPEILLKLLIGYTFGTAGLIVKTFFSLFKRKG